MQDISARAYAFDLASQINNTIEFQNDTTILLEFLLGVTGRQIDTASTKTTVTKIPLPVIEEDHDGAIITKESFELLAAGEFLKIPIMIGSTSEEDIVAATDLAKLRAELETVTNQHSSLVPVDFKIKDGVSDDVVGDKIYNLYLDGVSSEERLGYLIRYHSDNELTKPVIKHAELASNLTDVYFYIFSHDGPMGNFNKTVPGAGKVGHSEDTKYLWKVTSNTYQNGDLSQFPTADVITHKRLIELWTNFAKYLNPTPEQSDLLQNITWPKVTPDNFQYLDIGDDLVVLKDPKAPYYQSWSDYYDLYAKRPFTTF